MKINNSPHEVLLEKVIDMIYGEYDPSQITFEQQQENISAFKERLVKWKIDPGFRKILGPLQPSKILSKMVKVPVEDIEQIAKDLDITLPQEVILSEFNIDNIPETEVVKLLDSLQNDNVQTEQNILELLANIEKEKFSDFIPSSFEYVDLSDKDSSFRDEALERYVPSSFQIIKYLEELIEKIKRGQVHTISVISLLSNGNAAIYLPPEMQSESELYGPIIDLLREHANENNIN